MIPIMGVPFLELALRRIKEAGVEHVILPSYHLPEAITSYFGDGSRIGLRLTYVIEEQPLGTAGAIKNVESYIEGPFFVFNGDIMTSLDLKAMIAYHNAKGGIGTLHLIRVEDPSSFGAVVHDKDGRISSFVEKPPKGTSPSNDINAGTYLLERELLEFIPSGRNVSIERETFPAVIAAGKKICAYVTEDYWIDLGRPEHYLDAHRNVFDGAVPLGIPLAKSRVSGPGAEQPRGTLVPPVFIGRHATVEEGAHVGPYVVLGDGCRVGRGAHVRDSVLWDGVVVGDGSSVKDAIVASRVRIGANAEIGAHTVIGHDVAIADGAQIAENSRLSREGVASA